MSDDEKETVWDPLLSLSVASLDSPVVDLEKADDTVAIQWIEVLMNAGLRTLSTSKEAKTWREFDSKPVDRQMVELLRREGETDGEAR